jgi:hypothetical protein
MGKRLAVASVAVALLALGASGCGALFWGTTQTVTVDTDPPGGVIVLDGKRHKAPARLKLKKNKDYVVYAEWSDKTVGHHIGGRGISLNTGLGCTIVAITGDIFLLFVPLFVDAWYDSCNSFEGKVVISPEPRYYDGQDKQDAPEETP